jgi:Lrp/AsnC family transcriptional regulator for asnA, asnC and gidA
MMASKTDRKILALLQEDARTPISEIARKVNLSENGVRYRLEKLENQGFIKSFSVLLNSKKFGKKVTAIFKIDIQSKKMKEVIPELSNLKQLTKMYQTTGDYAITAIGLFKDHDELNDFINNKLLYEFPIKDYSVQIVTKKLKDSTYEV